MQNPRSSIREVTNFMAENSGIRNQTTWRLPLAAVLAAAMVSLVVGAREVAPAYQAEYLVRCGHQAGTVDDARVERLLKPTENQPDDSAQPKTPLPEQPRLTIRCEPVAQGTTIRVAYAGTDIQGYEAARKAAQQLAAALDNGPLTQPHRDDLLYGIDLQLVELTKPLYDQPLASIEAKRSALLAEKNRLAAIDLDYQWEAASVQRVVELKQPWQATIAAGAPAVLLIVSSIAAVRIFQRRPDPPATDQQSSAALLRIPSRTVDVTFRRSA